MVETAHCIYISREEYDQHLRQGAHFESSGGAKSVMPLRCCIAC